MIQEVYDLVMERLDGAKMAPPSDCRTCAIEELEEVLAIIGEVAEYYDVYLATERNSE